MRAVYANYEDTWYYLNGDTATPDCCTEVVTMSNLVDRLNSSTNCIKNNHVVIDLSLGDIYEATLTNGEIYKSIVDMAQEDVETKLLTLYPYYQIVVLYRILDKTTVSTSSAVPMTVVGNKVVTNPLYIDMGCLATSETVHRTGKVFKSRVKTVNTPSVEMGIMRTNCSRNNGYSILIDDIQLYQSTNPINSTKLEAANRHNSMCHTGYTSEFNYYNNDITYSSKLIYSLKSHGVTYKPIIFAKKPLSITFDINITMVTQAIGYNKSELEPFIYVLEGFEDTEVIKKPIWYEHCCHHVNGPTDCIHCRDYCTCTDPNKEDNTTTDDSTTTDTITDTYIRIRGDVNTYEELPQSGNKIGDLYHILYGDYANKDALWTGTEWRISDTLPSDISDTPDTSDDTSDTPTDDTNTESDVENIYGQ